ncbi:hypothetical protein GGR58DRAFT_388469 [Xylaria digitata]|nr:hypothetical protein GGR58DRAFT_388469 [Xylaria digitata]
MFDNRDSTTSPQTQTSARAAVEPALQFDNWLPIREDLPSDSKDYMSSEKPYASNCNRENRPVSRVGRRMGRTSQQLEVPAIQTRPRSTSEGGSNTRLFSVNLKPPPVSSDGSESENDVFSRGQGLIQSTEATSSVGWGSPLLGTNDESRQAPGPEDLLLGVQHDRAVSGNHHLEEDDSSLVEVLGDPNSPCDDCSLNIAKDSIRGGEITKGIPRWVIRKSAYLDSFSNATAQPLTVSTDPIPLKPSHEHLIGNTTRTYRDEATPSSESELDDPDQRNTNPTLRDRIRNCMKRTATGQLFLPNGSLDELITKDSVETELRRAFVHDKPAWDRAKRERRTKRLATRICIKEETTSYGRLLEPIRQIFAILVLIEKAPDVSLFIKEGLSDFDLPLSTIEDEEKQIRPERRRNSSRCRPLENLLSFQQWSQWTKDEFWEKQWKVIAPILSEGDYNNVQLLPLHEKDILPFVSCKQDVGHGGFSVVYTAHIHPRHHNFSDEYLCKSGFVIKQIDRVKRESFDKERGILMKFKGFNAHDHIVNLLSAFEQGNNLGLIFYRAEDDLRGFWRRKRPDLENKTHVWVAKQCAGLASALLKLHHHETFPRPSESNEDSEVPKFTGRVNIAQAPKGIHSKSHQMCGQVEDALPHGTHGTAITKHDICVSEAEPQRGSEPKPQSEVNQTAEPVKVRKYGRHGDIKPENILWYQDPEDELGVLRLTDFGVSDLKSGMSKSKIQSNIAGTLNYRAPEFDVPGWPIRQSADMWSLGCVYLEFITWLLGGENLVREFAAKRVSWDCTAHLHIDNFFESDYKNHQSDQTINLKVKGSVISFFNTLREHANCTEYLHDFLDLIQYRMLVLESPDTSDSDRILSGELSQKLASFYHRCCNEEAYATEKHQWKPRRSKPLNVLLTEMDIIISKGKTEENSSRASRPNDRYVISALQKRRVYTLSRGHEFKEIPQTH